MPIYEYRCTNGHTFEVFQSMSEDPLTKCVECQAPAERLLSPPAVHFKGTGFYTTDYGSKSRKAPAEAGAKSDSSSSSSDSSSSGSSSSD